MNGVPDSEVQRLMGARLKAIREALGLTQEQMATNMGVVVTTLSAWESGRNQIDIVKLAKSATRWGFTTDWVARGDFAGLRKDLADRLEALSEAEPAPRRGRPTGRHKERAPPTPTTPGKERPPPRNPTVGEPGETKREAGRPR